MGENILYTDRLELHRADAAYADRILTYVLENRKKHQSRNPIRPDSFYTIEEQLNRLTVSEDELVKYCVFKKGNPSRVIGEINFTNTIRGVLCSCFVGYHIHHSEEGKGYMTEALKGVLPYFVQQSGLHRIAAHIMPANKASIRVVEKAGFQQEGYFRKYLKINGKWEDHLAFSLLAEDIKYQISDIT